MSIPNLNGRYFRCFDSENKGAFTLGVRDFIVESPNTMRVI